MSENLISPDACLKIFYDWMIPIAGDVEGTSLDSVADKQHALLLTMSQEELTQLHGAAHKVAIMARDFLPVLNEYFARQGWAVPTWGQIDPPSSLRDPPLC